MKTRQIWLGSLLVLAGLAFAHSVRGRRLALERRTVPANASSERARPVLPVAPRAAPLPATQATAAKAVNPSRQPAPTALTADEKSDPALAVLAYPTATANEASLVRDLPALVDRWAASFPEEAAAWTEALPEGLARDLCAVTVANRRARANPMLAGVWLKSFPGVEDLLIDPPAGPARSIP